MNLYVEALEAYQASQTVWRAKIEDGANLGIGGKPDLKAVADNYPIRGSGQGQALHFDADTAIQTLWQVGRGKLAAANALYNDEEAQAVPPVQ